VYVYGGENSRQREQGDSGGKRAIRTGKNKSFGTKIRNVKKAQEDKEKVSLY
jgi:hypothetical protein